MIKKLLYLSNLTFLALYLILAWHNRLTMDDFHFMSNVHHYGVIQGTMAEYNFFSTRWLSVLVVHNTLSLMPYMNALFLIGITTLLAITISFSYLLKNILHLFFAFQAGTFLLVNLGIFTINAFFYSCIDIGNIWFWLSALPTYLWSFIFFLLGCGLILSSKKRMIPKFVLLAFSFFYIGGSAETFAAVVLLALFIVIIWLQFFKSSFAERKMYLVRLCIAFVFCTTSLVVLYMGHGNIVRRALIGTISIPQAFILNVKTTGWIGLHWISRILPVTLLFSLPLLYAGKILTLNNDTPPKSLSELAMTLFKAILLYGVLIYILNYPVTYLLCGISPGRALVPVSFLTWVLFAFIFFYIGNKTSIQENLAKRLVTITLGLCLLFNIYTGITQFSITREYATKYDALMEELTSKKDTISTIRVSPLPSSGMLTPLELSQDSLANNNMFIKTALGLKSDIMLIQ